MPVEVRVAASSIAGRGTFADRDLPTGTVIARFAAAPTAEADLGPLNHSCDPVLGWSGAALVTMRAVTADEELTLDYATVVSDPAFSFFCHCETYRCRQAIEGSDWRIPQLQRRYAGHWHPAVQRLIDESH